MKFCKDCKYYFPAYPIDPSPHRCKHPELCKIDVVTGGIISQDARLMRIGLNGCGVEGKKFELKPVEIKKNWFTKLFDKESI